MSGGGPRTPVAKPKKNPFIRPHMILAQLQKNLEKEAKENPLQVSEKK